MVVGGGGGYLYIVCHCIVPFHSCHASVSFFLPRSVTNTDLGTAFIGYCVGAGSVFKCGFPFNWVLYCVIGYGGNHSLLV